MTVYKADLEQARQRVEAWWCHEVIDRVVIQVTAPRGHCEPDSLHVADPRRHFTDPDVVIPRLKRRLEATYWGGESFPVMFPVAVGMVAILAHYLGCPARFVHTDTVWSEPIIADWEHRAELRFDPDNPHWRMSERLFEAALDQADGCFIGVPDLNGPTEVLARLRGTEALALDFMDSPQYIRPALAEVNRAWLDAYRACARFTDRTGGHFFWMGIWSDLPSIDLQSDFSCMIRSEMFDQYFLPSIEEQTRMVDRTIYHLDGPGAIQHLDSLLDLPGLDGIQWVPGAGAPPTIEWMPLLKRIQDAGKLLVAYCEPGQVETFLQELRPQGLMLATGCESMEAAEALLRNAERWTARRG